MHTSNKGRKGSRKAIKAAEAFLHTSNKGYEGAAADQASQEFRQREWRWSYDLLAEPGTCGGKFQQDRI